jgi:phospholipid/cholesterol/gamma-HCH transport system ATP-binding protein
MTASSLLLQANTSSSTSKNVIEMRGISTRFGDHVVHENLDLDVRVGEIFAIVGGSGSGKSSLLREMIMLNQANAGTINILDKELKGITEKDAFDLRQRCGVMFQHGGLFGTLSIHENIALPLLENTDLEQAVIDELAAWKLQMVGLKPETGAQFPSQLSGGMLKRASMARAIALDPELLFLDEPTAGLDPNSASGIDRLIHTLHDLFNTTIVIITHDLDLLWQVTDRVAVLGDGHVIAVGSMKELATMQDPAVRSYFDGTRARAAQTQSKTSKTSTTLSKAQLSPRFQTETLKE